MTNLQNLSVAQLRQLVALKQRIERLEAKLDAVTGGRRGGISAGPKRRVMSAAAKARIAAAQRRRWAKVRAHAGTAGRKPRRKVSAATKARLAAIARARWAKVKSAGKSAL